MISIVIPTYKLCSERLENLKFLLHYLSSINFRYKVCIIEQNTNNPCVYEVVKRYPRFYYFSYNIRPVTTFNKSKLYNSFLKECNSDYVWFYDIDVYLDIAYVTKNIPSEFDLIRPYEYIVNLNKKETENLRITNKIKLTNREFKINNNFGKYSFIVKKELVSQVGFDENYKGWGFQDMDLIKNIKSTGFTGYTKNIAFHLDHPPASLTFYQDNKKMFVSKNTKTKLIPKKNLKKLRNII